MDRAPNPGGLVLASLVLLLSSTIHSAPLAAPELVVHEWGTFTTVVSPSGQPVMWRPLLGDQDLPSFVHEREASPYEPDRPIFSKDGLHALVRMETPVVYFYTEAEVPVPVELSVGYSGGWLTEWFPHAELARGLLRWQVLVQPRGSEAPLAEDGSDSHYYAARSVDANVVVDSITGETDRLLFYRGVGNAKPAVSLREAEDGTLSVTAQAARGAALVVTADEASLCWQPVEVQVGLSQPGDAICGEKAVLEARIVEMLEASGLFADEARAMVATWEGHWFEPGVRLMSIVPRTHTDQLLPMNISPAPVALERVMVERTELLPQAGLDRLAADGGGRPAAEAIFGRFADAATITLQESGMLSLGLP